MAKLGAVLLAAGGSSRLGRSKQLLSYRRQTLVRRAARILVGLTPYVVVVTGANADEVARELEDLPVRMQDNTDWREGMGSSIARGVQAQPEGVHGVLLLLCDQYRINLADLERLAGEWSTMPDRIVAARWGRAFGPPVIFPRPLFSRLEKLSGDLGARQLLVEQRSRVRFMDLEQAAYDVDDPEDLEKMREFESDLGKQSGPPT